MLIHFKFLVLIKIVLFRYLEKTKSELNVPLSPTTSPEVRHRAGSSHQD